VAHYARVVTGPFDVDEKSSCFRNDPLAATAACLQIEIAGA